MSKGRENTKEMVEKWEQKKKTHKGLCKKLQEPPSPRTLLCFLAQKIAQIWSPFIFQAKPYTYASIFLSQQSKHLVALMHARARWAA